MTNEKILETISITFLYSIIEISKFVINLFFFKSWYEKAAKAVQIFLDEDGIFYAMIYFSKFILLMIFVSLTVFKLASKALIFLYLLSDLSV